MAMNSPPSRRYSAANAPITPTSDNALEIGCLWSTRFTAQTTAIAANRKNRIASILRQSHDETGDEQIRDSHREHKCPGEAHQLIVTEARKRSADPDIKEQDHADFRREPEQRHQN